MLDCLACLRAPEHEVKLGDGETVEFCSTCWLELEARLERVGAEYRSLVAGGMHPLLAERRMNEAVESRRI